jgi:DNA repair photolyase
VPVSVNVAPVVPGLTDHELPRILKAARQAGAQSAGYALLRLPYSISHMFTEWLEVHRPDAKNKVLQHIRQTREGKLNSSEWGERMRGTGEMADSIKKIFDVFVRKLGFNQDDVPLRTDLFRRPSDQLDFF